MGLGGAFRELGDFLEECERRGGRVTGVGVSECAGARAGEDLTADVEVTLATRESDVETTGAMRASTQRVESDGTLRFAFESTDPLVPGDDHDVRVDATDVTLNPDSTVTVTLSTTVGATDEGEASADEAAREDSTTPAVAAETRDVPPFRDPDLLSEVYDSCDTFAEMADALEMDVTAETVRRYMIDYNIHQPNTYATGSEEEPERDGEAVLDEPDAGDPVVLSDGIGLPDGVTADTLIETVKRSNTIYEVTQDIDIERDDALDMLQELNLLDLVVGRLATEAERDISRADIVERLRDASATG